MVLFVNPFRLNFEVTSYCKNFVAHKVKADHTRKLHRLIEVASNRFFHITAKLVEAFAICVDAVAQSTGSVTAVDLVFTNFKYDF